MPKLFEGQELNDSATMKLVDDINKEEEELEKNPPAKEGEPKEPELKTPEEKEPSSSAPERPVETVSLPKWKLLDYEKKLEKLSSDIELSQKEKQELSDKIAELSKHPPQSVDEEVKVYAESIGADPQAIQGLMGILAKRFAPPEDYQKIIEGQKKREEEERLKQEAFAEFETDFTALAAKQPESATLKEKLKELAFSDAYHTYSLAHIFALEKDNLLEPKKKTGEASRGKAEGRAVLPKIENIDEMSDKEFQEFSEGLSRKGTLSKT